MNIAELATYSTTSTLDVNNARNAMNEILSGNCKDTDIANFLAALAKRGETDDEIEGMLDSMMNHSIGVNVNQDNLIDVCGTGGDGAHTFNISTSAAFIAAAAGARVAKHGNRSSSGAVGSADIFERLGINLDSTPGQIIKMIDSHRIGFMFAPKFHPAMKNTRAARKIITGTRTILNLLGPLANPARVERSLVGVSSKRHLESIQSILMRRGAKSMIAVRSDNGLDELSTSSNAIAIIAQDNKVQRLKIVPTELGLCESGIAQLQVDGIEDAFGAFVKAIDGTASRAIVETVALNAGAALVAAGKSESITKGLETALETIHSGAASKLLKSFVASYGKSKSLEEIQKN